MNSENVYALRIESIRKMMGDRGWDAVVITGSDPHSSEYPAARWKQVQWICGFTGEAGDVVITADHAGLWTDTRYFVQAVEQLEGTGVELHKTRIPGEIRIPEWLADIAFSDRKDTVTVVVDGLSTALSHVDRICEAFVRAGRHRAGAEQIESGFRIVDCPDLMDALWLDRPAIPASPIFILANDAVGESRASKIQWLRDFMDENDCDAILLTALDEIAWLLNIRGSDVEYNPVVISYLIVTAGDVSWYVEKGGKHHDEIQTELEADGVQMLPYDDAGLAFAGLKEDRICRLCIDPATLNYHFSKLIVSSGLNTLHLPSPVPLRKAVKNATEISGMKEAHFEDGIVMEKFLFWLECQVFHGEPVTEWDVSVQLHSLRSGVPGYMGDSFETISAYGPSAALPHYVTPKNGSKMLEPHGLYLCDSGGQYLFGTTDITRTVPLGQCTDIEREDYTLVLKGHIALASAMFPSGTAGCQIDYAARRPLWQYQRNYGHGTGHGVGFFLNVHEGPQDIRQNLNPQPILPGMITSDEPGIYREGMHGIRHESLLLAIDAETSDFGSWTCFETLTLCHIDTSPIMPELMTEEEKVWLNSYNSHVYDTLSPHLPQDVAIWLRRKTMPI